MVSTGLTLIFVETYLVDVDGWAVVLVLQEMVVTHTDFTEVTRVELKVSTSFEGFRHPIG